MEAQPELCKELGHRHRRLWLIQAQASVLGALANTGAKPLGH